MYIHSLSWACSATKTVTPLLKIDTLKLVYIPYFNFNLSYGVFFWGDWADSKREFLHPKENYYNNGRC
jgi:hypothetical protein